jgi:hypothetical protein
MKKYTEDGIMYKNRARNFSNLLLSVARRRFFLFTPQKSSTETSTKNFAGNETSIAGEVNLAS